MTSFPIPRTGSTAAAAVRALAAICVVLAVFACLPAGPAGAQELSPEMLDEAARRTGLSREELIRRYVARQGAGAGATAEPTEPGRTSLEGIDDRTTGDRWRDTDAEVVLPFSRELTAALRDTMTAEESLPDSLRTFGADFFELDAGVFQPPSFGPVPADYRLGVGDELVVNAWGEVDFQLTRIVDRDGAIILPRSGKVVCAGRTLAAVENAVTEQLARSHASIATGDEEGGTRVEVTLGQLRGIRVFVIGRAVRPGSYELSSASSLLGALYAAGGPNELGSFRDIRLMRGDEQVGSLDLYAYLSEGRRQGDVLLREGDTVFIPDRLARVQIGGPVRRPMRYEMAPGEGLDELIALAGGFAPGAALETVHVERFLAPSERASGAPDRVLLDVPLDPATGRAVTPFPLRDGDRVSVGAVSDRLDAFVEVRGAVKRPGRYQYAPGATVADLLAEAGGLWPDALTEKAVLDRTSPERDLSTLTVPLADILAGRAEAPALQPRDVLHVFDRWGLQERPRVHISGEVHRALSEDWREGMTLRDLVLKAGGLKDSANLLHAEVARLLVDAVADHDIGHRPERTTEIIAVQMGDDFLTRGDGFVLQPHDRVAIRRLPWWELPRTVTVRGEVFYPGVFSLERKDERLSSLVARAGGLTPDAYALGARVVRGQDEVGNIAIDLAAALAEPGSEQDIILQEGDQIVVPDRMFTVKVMGEVGFPTSLVFEEGRKIDWYVERAGGYLEKADKGKTRVVWPNGMSLPNKGGSQVIAGSTIVVPVEPPAEGRDTWETIRDISSIVASLATVWLIVDK